MAAGEAGVPLPLNLKQDLSQVNADLYTAVSLWLRKHGKGIKPKLSDEQKQQLKECFELMDQDGSGAIDAEELGAAFKLLGIRMKRAELSALLAEVDHDGSGEVEYPEFLEIMTVTLQRLSEEEDNEKNEGQVPFALMATAYRRKRLMEGIINGDKEVQAQIQQISDKTNLEALQATKAAEVEALRTKGSSDSNGGGYNLGGVAQPGRTPSGRPLRRIGQVDVKAALLDTLGPDERRIVSALAGKASPSSSRAPPPPINLLGSTRPYGHFTNSPTHRQLMEQPTLLDLRFVNQSTIRLPPGAAGPVRSMSVASMAGTMSNTAAGGGGGGSREGSMAGSSLGLGAMLPTGQPGRRGSNGYGGRGTTPPMGGMNPAAAAAAWGAASLHSPGRSGRVDASEPLPQLRYEGGSVPFGGAKVPMGIKLGTMSGPHERVTRG